MIVPIQPDNCTVNGRRLKAHSPAWRGLVMAKAELRETSSLMELVCAGQNVPADHHLSVPFCDPGEKSEDYEGQKSRVRPSRKCDRFVLVDGVWMLDRHNPKPRKPTTQATIKD